MIEKKGRNSYVTKSFGENFRENQEMNPLCHLGFYKLKQ